MQWGVVETIVQSAAIYSISLITLLSTYLAGSNAQYICLDALQPIIVSTIRSRIKHALLIESTAGNRIHPDHHQSGAERNG